MSGPDPTPPNRDAFISYSTKDKEWADAACAALERRGLRCWIASRDIPRGSNWRSAIVAGIDACKMMVLIFSAEANASEEVHREVGLAVDNKIVVLPFRVEAVAPRGAIRYAISNTQQIDGFDPPREQRLEELADAVKALIGEEDASAKRPDAVEVTPVGEEPSEPDISEFDGFFAELDGSRDEQEGLDSDDDSMFAVVAPSDDPSTEDSGEEFILEEVEVPMVSRAPTLRPESLFGNQGTAAAGQARDLDEKIAAIVRTLGSAAGTFVEKLQEFVAFVVAVLLVVIFVGIIIFLGHGLVERILVAGTTNSLGIKFGLIPAGEFEMGSDASDSFARNDEKVNGKKHPVRITKPFYLGTTEVTVGQFRQFVDRSGYVTEAESDEHGSFGWNEANGTFERDPRYTWESPGFPQEDDHPVVLVSHNDGLALCRWLSEAEGRTYRLPTEAEWEFACRARGRGVYGSGDGLAELDRVAWFSENSRNGTSPVGRKEKNAFGLYDMLGNVGEWCADWYARDYDAKSPSTDPIGPLDGSNRVIRGGSWNDPAVYCRAAYRDKDAPPDACSFVGLRLVQVP